MSTPFGGFPARTAPGLPNLPTPPTGWPVGSYATCAEAQRAVDYLADRDFPVGDVTIVGVGLVLRRAGARPAHLGRVLLSGAASGAWFGLFVGLLLGLFSSGNNAFGPILVGLISGVLFGVSSRRSGTARRADGATSPPRARSSPAATTCCAKPGQEAAANAEKARELLAKLARPGAADTPQQ